MKKAMIALVASLTVLGASAQVDKAASQATDAARHKIDEKRADDAAAKSGPVGKTVNNVKSEYHKDQAKRSADNAKKSLEKAGS